MLLCDELFAVFYSFMCHLVIDFLFLYFFVLLNRDPIVVRISLAYDSVLIVRLGLGKCYQNIGKKRNKQLNKDPAVAQKGSKLHFTGLLCVAAEKDKATEKNYSKKTQNKIKQTFNNTKQLQKTKQKNNNKQTQKQNKYDKIS